MKKPQPPPVVLDHLEDLIQTFEYSLDIDETIALTLRKLMEHMHCEAASVFLNDDTDGMTGSYRRQAKFTKNPLFKLLQRASPLAGLQDCMLECAP